MKYYCIKLCRQMQEEFRRCKSHTACLEKNIECCFGVAHKYWNRVEEHLKTNAFKNEEQEIQFFKNLKPKFTSEIQYYSLVYHCLLFQPQDIVTAIGFLRREYGRWAKFEKENGSFIECLNNDHCELNRYYFLPKYYTCKNELDINLYVLGMDAVTNGDNLAAMLLALSRYTDFVSQRLHLLADRSF